MKLKIFATQSRGNKYLVPVGHGKHAIVDLVDRGFVDKYVWHISQGGYAASCCSNGKGKRIGFMHRHINKTKPGFLTDHINRNRLDNRRSNLRTVDLCQNGWNSKARRDSATGFKGVEFNKQQGKYKVRVRARGVKFNFGSFSHLSDAVKRSREARAFLHGEFAHQ